VGEGGSGAQRAAEKKKKRTCDQHNFLYLEREGLSSIELEGATGGITRVGQGGRGGGRLTRPQKTREGKPHFYVGGSKLLMTASRGVVPAEGKF